MRAEQTIIDDMHSFAVFKFKSEKDANVGDVIDLSGFRRKLKLEDYVVELTLVVGIYGEEEGAYYEFKGDKYTLVVDDDTLNKAVKVLQIISNCYCGMSDMHSYICGKNGPIVILTDRQKSGYFYGLVVANMLR